MALDVGGVLTALVLNVLANLLTRWPGRFLRLTGRLGLGPRMDVKVLVTEVTVGSGTVFRVAIENRSASCIVVQDVRLMIKEPVGIPYNHRARVEELGIEIPAGTVKTFEFHAWECSRTIRELYHPRGVVSYSTESIDVIPRCILGSGKTVLGEPIGVSTDYSRYRAETTLRGD